VITTIHVLHFVIHGAFMHVFMLLVPVILTITHITVRGLQWLRRTEYKYGQ